MRIYNLEYEDGTAVLPLVTTKIGDVIKKMHNTTAKRQATWSMEQADPPPLRLRRMCVCREPGVIQCSFMAGCGEGSTGLRWNSGQKGRSKQQDGAAPKIDGYGVW